MKALILAAGDGTRLQPVTHTTPKPLIPVADKPIIFHIIGAILETGITEIGIVVGARGEKIKRAVGSGVRWGVRISYIKQPKPLGLAHAVHLSQSYVRKEPFLVFLGDNLLEKGIVDATAQFRAKTPAAQVLLSPVKDPCRFGVAELRRGKVVKLVEKPKNPPSNLAIVGVYMFNDCVFGAIKNITPSWRGELEITDAIQYLIRQGCDVESYVIDGWWKDVGELEDLLEANRLMMNNLKPACWGRVDDESRLRGKVLVQRGARVVNSVVNGPAIIGERSEVVNSFFGPFVSLSPEAVISRSYLEDCIVLERASLKNIRSFRSGLAAQRAQISSSTEQDKKLPVLLQETSEVSSGVV